MSDAVVAGLPVMRASRAVLRGMQLVSVLDDILGIIVALIGIFVPVVLLKLLSHLSDLLILMGYSRFKC